MATLNAPRIFGMKIAHGKDAEKPIYYLDGNKSFNPEREEWSDGIPAAAHELTQRPVCLSDLHDLIFHGLIQHGDYMALDSKGLVDDKSKALYQKLMDMQHRIDILEMKMSERAQRELFDVETDDSESEDESVDPFNTVHEVP